MLSSVDSRCRKLWAPETIWGLSLFLLLLLGSRGAGQEVRLLRGHIGPDHPHPKLDRVSYSPDGRLLASGGRCEDQVIVWDTTTGEKVRSFNARHLSGFVFSPDGRAFVIAGNFEEIGKGVVIYEVATWKERLRMETENIIDNVLEFSRDGKFLAWKIEESVFIVCLGPSEMRVAKLLSVEKKNKFSRRILFSPDTKQLIVSYSEGTISFWDWPSGQEVADQSTGKYLHGMALSSDGKTLMIIHDLDPLDRRAGVLQLRNLPSGTWRRGIIPPTGEDGALASAAQAEVLVTAGDRSLCIFKGSDGEVWATRFIHKGAKINALSLSPDGKRIVTTNSDGTVSLIDVPKEKEKPKLKPDD